MGENTEHLVQLPLRISWEKNKRGDLAWFALNLNEYRNAHHRILHNAKVAFEDMAVKLVRNLPKMRRVEIEYHLWLGTARKADLLNIGSVVDKFFCDALVKAGVLPDDNIDVLADVHFHFKGVDRDNPRIDAIIRNLESERDEEPMRITVEAHEIESIVRAYVEEQIVLKDGQEMFFSSGEDGSYVVDILASGQKPQPKPAAPKARAARAPRAVAATAAEVAETPANISTGENRTDPEFPDPSDLPFEADPAPADKPVAEEEKPFTPPAFLARAEKPKVEAEAPTGQSSSRSLFGHLKPPVNA